jgi:biotin synthase
VIKKISEPEAESILSVWKETFFELQEMDLKLSYINLEEKGIDKKTASILDRISEGGKYGKKDLLYLYRMKDERNSGLILKTANFLRQKHLKNSCCVHGIIEISNHCRQECHYCGISAHNKGLTRYRMSREEIFSAAHEAVEKYGFKALVLQSGEDSGYQAGDLAEVVKEIHEKLGALIFISFGEVGIKGLEKLYAAGARGMLMRFETSNPALYEKVRPGCRLETRLEHLRKAFDMGYLILTGALIGVPGQTDEDVVNDIYLTKDLNAEMYSFGPFIPHPETLFAGAVPPKEEDVLKAIALCRFADPDKARILVTTGFETLSKDARKKGLMAGANSVMLNVTPLKYRKLYSIYPRRAHENEEIGQQIEETINLLRSLGRAPTDLGAGR